MTPERWKQIEKLYYAARKREPGQRAAFLDQVCAGDEALRREVESLLASDEQASDFLATPALRIAAEEIAEEQSRSLIGRQVGHYRILSLLGAGGMGEVYLAEDARLGRKVALKLLPAKFTQDRERLRRFEQEARAASALNHPNIVTIFEIGEVEGIHFIATEYIDGQTLRGRMVGAPVKLSEALDVAMQVASALAAAHEAGIVHRDIKPENIMLRRDGYIKVLDFGLAKLIAPPAAGQTTVIDSKASTKEQIKTDPGRLMGTARYMSPEQIRGQKVDCRSDIFSLGVELYEMVAGRAPFVGATAGEVIAAILNQEPLLLARYSREVPAELERMVSRALAKDREARYQVVKDLLIDLKSLKLELELEAKLKRAGHVDERDEAEQTDQPPLTESIYATRISPPSHSPALRKVLEPVGGAMPLDSEFYIVRPTDAEFQSAIAQQESIVLVKGARQVGKTSLLARGLQQAREAGPESSSPFNVGTRLLLEDFSFEQVAELNRRYGSPLRDRAEVARYFRLVGGHPYLVRRGLYEMAVHGLDLAALEAEADHDEGPFGNHLRRILVSLSQDPALCEAVRGVLQGHPSATTDSFYRLRSAGLITGDSVRDIRPRSQLYATYLEKHLL